MIDVSIVKEYDDFIEMTTNGHALYDDEGKDIVCAAVSILVINTINSMEKYTDCALSVETNQNKGYINCKINNPCEESNLLMKSLVLGLKSVEETYSKEYLKINIKEV